VNGTGQFKKIPVSMPPRTTTPLDNDKLSRVCMALVFGWAFLECCLMLAHKSPGQWMRAVFLLMALLATLVSEARGLPMQNVLFASALIAVITGIVEAIGEASGIPFGPRVFLDDFGSRIFETLPLVWPALWIVLLLNSRGVARLILRPWRKSKSYGFRVIGLTCLLVIALDLGFEPFANRANRCWVWQIKKNILSWFDAPWVNFFSVGVTTLLVLAFVTPWLINKHPSKRQANFQPLWLWLLMIFYFAVANAIAGLWPAVGVGVLAGFVTATFALRGAKWGVTREM